MTQDFGIGRKGGRKTGVHGVIDIGSTKVSCLIGRIDGEGSVRVIGCGWQGSHGVRSGSVVDLGQAEKAIRAAVDQAEKQADFRLRSATVNLSCGQPESHSMNLRLAIGGRAVTGNDLRRAMEEGKARSVSSGRSLVHLNPLGFSVDGTTGVQDPRGQHCDHLSTRLHVIDTTSLSLKNLGSTLTRCDLDVDEIVPAPVASSLSVLVDDERELGAILIDMGGGTTSLAVHSENQLIFTAQLPLGGIHVTRDIAGMMSTPVGSAERLKVVYGHAERAVEDDREYIDVQQIGGDDNAFVRMPRNKIAMAVRPRLEETFELLKDKLENAGLGKMVAARIVLTGGASQIDGAGALAARILGRPVRLGRPRTMPGLPGPYSGPGFATATGLLLWASGLGRVPLVEESGRENDRGYIGRLIELIKRSV